MQASHKGLNTCKRKLSIGFHHAHVMLSTYLLITGTARIQHKTQEIEKGKKPAKSHHIKVLSFLLFLLQLLLGHPVF